MNNQPTDEQIENSTVLGDELFPTIVEIVQEESEEIVIPAKLDAI